MLADQYKTEQNQFDRLGHPGRIYSAYRYTGGQVDFTGSMYGYGALQVQVHGGATASLSGGGTGELLLSDFDTGGNIYPLSISKIHGGSSSIIYIYKVQGTI